MSLMGIDVGSSSTKVGIYGIDGRLIADGRREMHPEHPQPGWWEQDPDEVWQATSDLIRELVHTEAVRRDPPRVMAISASVRENFPADAEGNPLAHCIMAADVRGAEYEIPPEGAIVPETWSYSCGHMRERMDPVNRLQWWRKNRPEVMAQATYFLGWHEFLSLRSCGRAVLDRSIASRWLLFDLASQDWCNERCDEYDIREGLLPEVLPWGALIGNLKQEVADAWGIQAPLSLAVGGADLNCAALGAGVSAVGDACMASGSFENLLVPISGYPTAPMLVRGLSVTPHPGTAGRAVWAISPTGTAVLDWSRTLLGISIAELDRHLATADRAPSHVLAVPYLSGAFSGWERGRELRGALLGLTLATAPLDIVKAFMESIAYDNVNALALLRDGGMEIESVRATGGGTRSTWWNQLKADMMGVPVEVADQKEPGTLGAALLAGFADGTFKSLSVACKDFGGTRQIYEPDLYRGEQHREKLGRYRQAVEQLLAMRSSSQPN